jgi:serine/threonine-protein kinase
MTQTTFIKNHLEKLAGRYRFERLLGQGGMGVVFKAYDTLLARDVAIKILNEELRENREAQRIFLVEARNLATLKHPNLVAIHDVAITDGVTMLVTEFVEGRNLEEHLQFYGSMDELAVLKVAHQLALALANMHERGIIHRDIKPGNLLVRQDGSLKIVDFGLARSLEQLTLRSTQRRGTPAYMAPEQIKGEELTPRTDLYQVGVTLYELATGFLPFDADGEDLAYAHVHLAPTPILEYAPMSSPGFCELVEQCLAKDPARRPASAAAFAASIEQVLLEGGGDATEELRVIGALDFALTRPEIDLSLEGLETSVPATSVDTTADDRQTSSTDLALAPGHSATKNLGDAYGDGISSRQALSILAALIVVLILCAGTIIALLGTAEDDSLEQPADAPITRADDPPADDVPEVDDGEAPPVVADTSAEADRTTSVDAAKTPEQPLDEVAPRIVEEGETSSRTKRKPVVSKAKKRVEPAPELVVEAIPEERAQKKDPQESGATTPSATVAKKPPEVSPEKNEETDANGEEEKAGETTRRVIRRKVIRQKTTPKRKIPRSF